MKIVVAMDSFKGSCTAYEAGEAVRAGIERAIPHANVINIPVADGGEGTVSAMIANGRGKWVCCAVSDPMGRRIEAGYGVMTDGTCIIEMSAASGLLLVPEDQRDPRIATTYGTGELIKHALDAGHRRMLIGLGGSATNDGGAGMAQALGVRFLDDAGKELPFGGAALANLHKIDISGLDARLRECSITCAVDVINTLCGPRGASAVFGPQKGATPQMVELLDAALRHYAKRIVLDCGAIVDDLPGSGAAGGLGAGLSAFCGGMFRSGIDAVLEVVGFDEAVRGAAFVVTGEGRMDGQTLSGKVPVGVATRTKMRGDIPVFALCGALGSGAEATYACGIDAAFAIADGPMTLDESCACVQRLLESAAHALGRTARSFASRFNTLDIEMAPTSGV